VCRPCPILLILALVVTGGCFAGATLYDSAGDSTGDHNYTGETIRAYWATGQGWFEGRQS
jgi:hypothetical protein